jgi:NAD(P)-dependent dehydrogenase (short-subunit alcohol dehydrogenase family)
MSRFNGQRAIVTAAGAGIARAIAEQLLSEGASVFAGDVDTKGLASLPDGITHQRCDVSNRAEVDAFFDAALAHLGGVDILINAAGIKGPTGAIEDTDPAAWTACIDVNLPGAYHCLRRVLGPMKAQGSGAIINFSSTGGLYGYQSAARIVSQNRRLLA